MKWRQGKKGWERKNKRREKRKERMERRNDIQRGWSSWEKERERFKVQSSKYVPTWCNLLSWYSPLTFGCVTSREQSEKTAFLLSLFCLRIVAAIREIVDKFLIAPQQCEEQFQSMRRANTWLTCCSAPWTCVCYRQTLHTVGTVYDLIDLLFCPWPKSVSKSSFMGIEVLIY